MQGHAVTVLAEVSHTVRRSRLRHVKAIQERLGHSTVTLTLDRYGHLLTSLDEILREQLEETFSRSLAA